MDIGLIFVVIAIASILVTLILDLIFKKKRYIKYIPVAIMFPFMLYNFITMYSATSESFKALGNFVMGLFLLTASVSSLVYSIIADILYRRKRKY